jgi:hypothetical protein
VAGRVPVDLLHDGGNPYAGEAHALNVVEFRYQAAPCSTTVYLVSCPTGCRRREISPSEPISNNLVNRLLPPLLGRESCSPWKEEEAVVQDMSKVSHCPGPIGSLYFASRKYFPTLRDGNTGLISHLPERAG